MLAEVTEEMTAKCTSILCLHGRGCRSMGVASVARIGSFEHPFVSQDSSGPTALFVMGFES